MNNQDYNNQPWDPDSYETGSTNPPKSRGGWIAVLLIAVIFLGGICCALGIMNVKLFQKLQSQQGNDAGLSFHESTVPSQTGSTQATQGTSLPAGSEQIQLKPAPESVPNVPQTGGLSYQEIYEKAIPSVVSITCQLPGGVSTGTGVVVSESGYLITNAHVVAGAQGVSVLLTDNRRLSARLVGADTVSDLAVLYVEAEGLVPAEFGDSGLLQVGDAVAAIGDPLGQEFRGTMTDGIVSAINRNVESNGRTMTLIQTNAALNSGNSGGPLLNCYGQVVGINTMKISAFVDSAGVEGLGFAIPSTTVKEIAEQLIAKGYVSGRPSVGMEYDTVSALEQRLYRLPAGALVESVVSGGCADKAGLTAGDVILTANGVRVESESTLTEILYGLSAGDALELTVYRYRGGTQFAVTLTLDEEGA